MHLSERRTELFREVRRLYRGASPALEEAWGEDGPFWGRHYVFWAGEVPLCVIYEVSARGWAGSWRVRGGRRGRRGGKARRAAVARANERGGGVTTTTIDPKIVGCERQRLFLLVTRST